MKNGVELAGGNTAAPIFREIIKSLNKLIKI